MKKMIKMYVLFVLLSLSSAAFAMDVPETVAMSDDAPSFISKEGHKLFCGACCASACAVTSACFALHHFAALQQAMQHNNQQCGLWQGCNDYDRRWLATVANPMSAFVIITFPPTLGYLLGSELGATTYRLDQRLHPQIKKEKMD